MGRQIALAHAGLAARRQNLLDFSERKGLGEDAKTDKVGNAASLGKRRRRARHLFGFLIPHQKNRKVWLKRVGDALNEQYWDLASSQRLTFAQR